MPESVELNDDTRLEGVKFNSDDHGAVQLSTIEQVSARVAWVCHTHG